jgi:hypothetical protein
LLLSLGGQSTEPVLTGPDGNAAFLSDAPRGRLLHRVAWAIYGTAEFHLAILADTVGRTDDAIE